jgi:hypothetical protein
MKPQFTTTTLLSVASWLDNIILQNGQAYTNYTSQFVYQPDQRLGPGFVAFQAPFKEFVWDSGVSGATVFNTVSGVLNGQPFVASRGTSGMMTDFVNGRVIFPVASGFNSSMIISGSYAFKDFNVYFANQSQEQIVFTNKYYLNSRFANTGLPPAYDMVTPCIFITNANERNDNWAMGGIYNTVYTISLNILAENMSQLEGAMSILADQKNGYMPQIPVAAWPLNFYGDYQGSGWNYQKAISQYGSPGNLYFISNVRGTKVSDYVKIDEALFLGIVDITLEWVRNLR